MVLFESSHEFMEILYSNQNQLCVNINVFCGNFLLGTTGFTPSPHPRRWLWVVVILDSFLFFGAFLEDQKSHAAT